MSKKSAKLAIEEQINAYAISHSHVKTKKTAECQLAEKKESGL